MKFLYWHEDQSIVTSTPAFHPARFVPQELYQSKDTEMRHTIPRHIRIPCHKHNADYGWFHSHAHGIDPMCLPHLQSSLASCARCRSCSEAIFRVSFLSATCVDGARTDSIGGLVSLFSRIVLDSACSQFPMVSSHSSSIAVSCVGPIREKPILVDISPVATECPKVLRLSLVYTTKPVSEKSSNKFPQSQVRATGPFEPDEKCIMTKGF